MPKENLIIAGDFKTNLFSSLASEFEEMMLSNNLIPTVSQATHERPGCKPSLIDNILINSTENHILSGVLQSRVSHHFPIFNVFTCPVLNAQANSEKNVPSYDFCESNIENLKNDLTEKFSEASFDYNSQANFCNFIEIIQGGNAILGYFRPYLSRAIFGFSSCTWPKIALKLKQVNICSSNK